MALVAPSDQAPYEGGSGVIGTPWGSPQSFGGGGSMLDYGSYAGMAPGFGKVGLGPLADSTYYGITPGGTIDRYMEPTFDIPNSFGSGGPGPELINWDWRPGGDPGPARQDGGGDGGGRPGPVFGGGSWGGAAALRPGSQMNDATYSPWMRRLMLTGNRGLPVGPQAQPGGPLTGYLPLGMGGEWTGDNPTWQQLTPEQRQGYINQAQQPPGDRFMTPAGMEWDPYARMLAGRSGNTLPGQLPSWMTGLWDRQQGLYNQQADASSRALQRQAELGARLNPNLDPSQRAYLGMQAGINTYGAQMDARNRAGMARNEAELGWYQGNQDYLRQAQRDAAQTAWGRTGADEQAMWQQRMIEAQRPKWYEAAAGLGGQALGGWASSGFRRPWGR